jgi:membrane protease YdiL (CAAX protease family)
MASSAAEHLKNFFFTCDKKERERGDDLGIFVYGISWAYFGAILVILQDPQLENAMKTYIYFDILCVLFIMLHLWRSKNKKIDLPTRSMWIRALPTIAVLMSVLYIASLIIRAMFSAQLYSTPEFIFEYFRIIPTEELAFRGLGIEIFLLLDERSGSKERTMKGASLKDLINEHKVFYIGAIASSILFGSLHYRAYPHQTIPLIYLTLLGFCLAFLRFKYGLFACLMLHAVNNLYASAVLAIILFHVI